jgi:hypothetical protein
MYRSCDNIKAQIKGRRRAAYRRLAPGICRKRKEIPELAERGGDVGMEKSLCRAIKRTGSGCCISYRRHRQIRREIQRRDLGSNRLPAPEC